MPSSSATNMYNLEQYTLQYTLPAYTAAKFITAQIFAWVVLAHSSSSDTVHLAIAQQMLPPWTVHTVKLQLQAEKSTDRQLQQRRKPSHLLQLMRFRLGSKRWLGLVPCCSRLSVGSSACMKEQGPSLLLTSCKVLPKRPYSMFHSQFILSKHTRHLTGTPGRIELIQLLSI